VRAGQFGQSVEFAHTLLNPNASGVPQRPAPERRETVPITMAKSTVSGPAAIRSSTQRAASFTSSKARRCGKSWRVNAAALWSRQKGIQVHVGKIFFRAGVDMEPSPALATEPPAATILGSNSGTGAVAN